MNFRHFIASVSMIGLLLGMTGCQTAPTRFDEVKEGQWTGRILIKDKRQNKSFIVSVDIHAKKADQLRMDVTAAMGTPVAAFVMDGDRTEYILFKQKAYYQGKTQPKVLLPILSLSMDPRLFFNLLFEEEPKGRNWSCSRDEQGFLKLCKDQSSDLSLEWTERKGERKTVEVQHPRSSLQINLNNFRPKVVENESMFKLRAPSGFKSYQIR